MSPSSEPTDRATLRDALFRPRSIGLVGLSSDTGRPNGRTLDYLRRAGYGGNVYVVNPRRDEVQGAQSYASLADLPETPEHVYVLLGTDLAGQAVADCAEAGVKVVTVLADGFAEPARRDAFLASIPAHVRTLELARVRLDD